MGAGRKTETIYFDGVSPIAEHGHISSRNLPKNDLGGAIFGCKHSTMEECLAKQLFGLPSSHFSYVRNIEPGLPIFLFNYSDRKLHGLYEAASHGKMHLDAYAWTDGGAERTAFPAQVRIRTSQQCKPLAEKEYRKVIDDNYYTPQHFWFELDHLQTRSLIAMFKPHPQTIAPAVYPPSQANSFPALAAPKWKLKKDAQATSSEKKNKFAVLSLENRDIGDGSRNKSLSISKEELGYNESASNLGDWFEDYSLDGTSSRIGTDFNEVTENFDKLSVDVDEYTNVLLKLKNLSDNCKFIPSREVQGESSSSCVLEDLSDHNRKLLDVSCTLAEKNENLSAGNLYHGNVKTNGQYLDFCNNEEHQAEKICCNGSANMGIGTVLNESSSLVNQEKDSASADLSHGAVEFPEVIRELNVRIETLEKKQVESDTEIQRLIDLHINSERIIQLLSARLGDLETKIGIASEDIIYLIGGYNGSAWLSAFDSFSTSLDILTPLRPMSYARSYASAVELNGVIYALGGGDGSSWYDTVERYDQSNGKWTSCPNMNHGRGSLASAILNGKIYAIGGGDGSECFSDVEMFDPALERWIPWHSLLHKRFAPAAAELNGVVYAVGGYDGKKYLNSVERLDPREFSWRILSDMKTPRGCHSMAVLNEKLYVMGGYDGNQMVSSVEVYDPRANAWMDEQPMNHTRGYAASALVGDSLFMIGGIDNYEGFVQTIEYYKEGDGWNRSHLSAVGNRCYFSAIVL
ncbi:hypothetical protein KSP39_PZI010498 [Platanthera zijinensis]|uniref:DCD domain-containing protein n=1 Tax=Platanthera zijinensis TaxID=2320716 RepID=A0AAP0BLJ5_9ASPA